MTIRIAYIGAATRVGMVRQSSVVATKPGQAAPTSVREDAHLAGAVAAGLKERSAELFSSAPRLGDGEYGIFDVFPDGGARFAHLTGHVPRELAKHTLTILGSVRSCSPMPTNQLLHSAGP